LERTRGHDVADRDAAALWEEISQQHLEIQRQTGTCSPGVFWSLSALR